MRIITVLLFGTSMFFSYKDALSLIPVTIKGVVRDAATHQPLANTYVYIIKGEEESLTNKRGEFSIETWQRLPLWLIVQQGGGKEKKLKVTAADTPIEVLVKME